MHFLLLTDIQLIDFRSVLLLRPLQQETDKEGQRYTHPYEIKNLGSRAPIKRRMNGYFQARFLITPNTVIIRGFYLENVCSGRQVGISSFILRTYIIPVFIKTFQFIGVLVLFGCTIAQ